MGVGWVVTTGSTRLAVTGVLAATFAVVAVVSPARITLVLLVVLPFLPYSASVGQFSLFIGLPAAMLVSLVLLMRYANSGLRLDRRLPRRSMVVLVAIGLGTAIVASDPTTAASRMLYVAVFAVLAWGVGAALLSSGIRRDALVRAVVFGAAIAAIALIGQAVYGIAAGRGPVTDWLRSIYPTFAGERAATFSGRNFYVETVGFVRAVFPFMSAPSAGQYMMLALVAAVWLWRRPDPRPVVKTLDGVALLLITAGLLFTISRQSWIGAAVGVLALGVQRRRLQTLVTVGVGLIIAGVTPIPGSGTTFGAYVLTAGDTSTTSSGTRLGLWEQAIQLIPQHAEIGVGAGLYGTLNPNPEKPLYYAHNVFLDASVELGVIGALVLIAVFLLSMRSALRQRATLGFALLVAFVTASLFDDVLYFPRNGMLLAIAFALCVVGDERVGSAPRAEPVEPQRLAVPPSRELVVSA